MIALETSDKMNKSPRKPKVEIRLANDDAESSDDIEVDSGDEIEENNVESADEGDIESESGNENVESGSAGEEDGSSVSNSDEEADKSKANPGWADAMQKILRTKKPKRKKTIVLSKAKRLCDVVPKEKKESPDFQVEEGEDGAVAETTDSTKTSEAKKEKEEEHSRRKRREVDLGIRVKPSVIDREREKTLQKIATKGVVQLFNAVRQQQKDIDKRLEEAGPLERKREMVLKNIDKRAFLDVLMGGSKSVSVDNPVKSEKQERDKEGDKGENEKTWDVLRDDFMMGAKLKDWDKNVEEDADSSAPEDMDSDD